MYRIQSMIYLFYCFIIPLPALQYFVSGKHSLRASDELMEKAMLSERNLSVRMTELVGAVIRPLLANLPQRMEQFSRRYHEVRTAPEWSRDTAVLG